jgi:predicted XRE-type DNA-binding protein
MFKTKPVSVIRISDLFRICEIRISDFVLVFVQRFMELTIITTYVEIGDSYLLKT